MVPVKTPFINLKTDTEEIIFKGKMALTIFHIMQWQIWSFSSSDAASHVLGTQYKKKVSEEQKESLKLEFCYFGSSCQNGDQKKS